ncbi:spore cortex biosynthesis protein YabQ [Holdemania massiliensis]|uniref:Spore cortex biosynthesis protein YabQ n=1 Tax=Holdemania massiliensis TaxID=1468449 RepID=A0A6N7SBC3_9FIRM|nr:spore cortex biosynthesis protein YabQ [Holdemania massiliensis]MSA72861.1 hypothetical protein [Holdemania massiliensis]MSA91147.1 hypothetical protein [Holdemania massiliensis]MSB80265.1 hypothetical protein [Holdemania massiliensis]MSC35186.1 hypothetical protein [Holdemania massiliensis]MSC41575.1 hypothetical protein [Holdemania massiliensis]
MILLPQQFQALVYHFFSGWVFALTWSGMNRLTWHFRRHVVRWVIETLYFFVFVTLMYAGLLPITGGQTQMYLILVFVLGAAIYLKFYAMTFSPVFEGIVRWGAKQLTCLKTQKAKNQAVLKQHSELRRKKKAEKLQLQKAKHQKKHQAKQAKKQLKKQKRQAKRKRKHPEPEDASSAVL